jgi:D-tyrosyl-tRNA(Tyr) deacylase
LKAVIQRVKRASVTVDGEIVGKIEKGLLVLLGVSKDDKTTDADYLADKILNLRIFEDADEKMNFSLLDINGQLLVVSQFTLYADTRKGRRPSFVNAAPPQQANELYEYLVSTFRRNLLHVETGKFQAMMDVELVNDGPVTIIIDSSRVS